MGCPDNLMEIAKEGRSWLELIVAVFIFHIPPPRYMRKKDDIGKDYFEKPEK